MSAPGQIDIVFRGHSDDTAGCYWTNVAGKQNDVDHDDCAAGSVRVFHVAHGDHRMAVSMQYGAGAMWVIGIGPITDDEPMPPWPMRWQFEGYTTVLTVVAPIGARVALHSTHGENEMRNPPVPEDDWTVVE